MRAGAGHGVNVGLLLDAAGEHVVERRGVRVLDGHAVAGHHAEHSEDIQHGLVDAVGGKVAKAVEIGLVLELEGPWRPGPGGAA